MHFMVQQSVIVKLYNASARGRHSLHNTYHYCCRVLDSEEHGHQYQANEYHKHDEQNNT